MLQGLLKGKPRVGFLADIVAIEAQSAIQKNQSIMRLEYRVAIRKKIDYLRNEQYNEPIWRVEYEAEVRE